MKRSNEKITDAIKSGKKPRRGMRGLINLAKIDMSDEERAAYDAEWDAQMVRARIGGLGYQTDPYGYLIGRGQ